MSSTPLAVASYVVGRNLGVDEGFLASLLVVSTAASVVAVPAWLYFVL
jgi:predicted permease